MSRTTNMPGVYLNLERKLLTRPRSRRHALNGHATHKGRLEALATHGGRVATHRDPLATHGGFLAPIGDRLATTHRGHLATHRSRLAHRGRLATGHPATNGGHVATHRGRAATHRDADPQHYSRKHLERMQTFSKQVDNMEAEMLTRHATMYKDLTASRQMVPEKLDRRIAEYNRDVIRYDRAVAALSDLRLDALGGLGRVFRTQNYSQTSSRSLGSQLAQCVEYGANPSSSDNRHGAPRHAHHIGGFLSQEEARVLRRLAQELGFRAVVSTVNFNSRSLPERTHSLCVLHNKELANWMWERLLQSCPDSIPADIVDRDARWVPVRVNPNFRFNQYFPGQQFSVHVDDVYYSRDATERSFLTLLIYLNDGFEGGHTVFLRNRKGGVVSRIQPSCGGAMVFQHDMLHAGTQPTGQPAKISVRTDIVFRRVRRQLGAEY